MKLLNVYILLIQQCHSKQRYYFCTYTFQYGKTFPISLHVPQLAVAMLYCSFKYKVKKLVYKYIASTLPCTCTWRNFNMIDS